MTPVIYLHGFASSPASQKARYFSTRLAAAGVPVTVPDLAEDGFENLTLTAQLRIVERQAAGRPAIVMGSSMGGYLAALYAARHPEVEKLVLMAPAFDFAHRWREHLGAQRFAEWEATGRLPVYHYGRNREAWVGFDLYRDALGYEAFPRVSQPALIFHGLHDEVVPHALAARFAEVNPGTRIRLFESGHELTDVLEPMWEDTWRFLSA